jgi:hypothetical protein
MGENNFENTSQNNSSNSSAKPKRVSKNGKPLGRPSYASQGKLKKADMMHTYKIDVPNGDVSVIQWMEMQDDIAISIRLLIKDYITRKGFNDVACLPAEYNPVGRKPKETPVVTEPVAQPSQPVAAAKPETFVKPVSAPKKVEPAPVVYADDDEDDDDMGRFFGNNRL